jgi:hypothetical protein
MNKNAREKELLEEAYASLYERKNPDADTYGGGLTGPFGPEEEGPNFEDNELDILDLIAADTDEEDDVDLDEDKDENKDENITQGGGTSAKAAEVEDTKGAMSAYA